MIRTVIVDDEELARQRMKRKLAEFPDIEIVGEGASGLDAIKLAAKMTPELVGESSPLF